MSSPAAKIDGPALREVTVRDYKRNAERAGVPVDMAAIERLALADCDTYAAVLRDDRGPSTPAPPDPAKEAEKSQALEREIAEKCPGAELLDEPVQSVPIPLFADKNKPDSKWAAVTSRFAAICRGANPLAFAYPGASTTEIMRAITSTCEIPALAMEIENLKAHWGMYIALGPAANKATQRVLGEPCLFAGMNLLDAGDKYKRLAEDICDRSESKLGSWWTRGLTFRGKR